MTKGTRLSEDWQPSPSDLEYIKKKRPDLNIEDTADDFRCYWLAKPGKDACKLRWDLTWQMWVRRAWQVRGNTMAGEQRPASFKETPHEEWLTAERDVEKGRANLKLIRRQI